MIIGIDIDDCLANFVTALNRWHNKTFNTNFKKSHYTNVAFPETWGGTFEEALDKVFRFYSSDDFKTIKPNRGAIEIIDQISQKHELYVITSRAHEIESLTHEWINCYFPNKFRSVIHTNQYNRNRIQMNKSKVDICKEIKANYLIDDMPKYITECANTEVSPIIFDQPWNRREMLPNIPRAKNWQEVLNHLNS
jgi:uncharacterized HAD superfamily protein